MIQEALAYLAKLQTPKNPVTVDVHNHPFRVKVDGTLGEPVIPVVPFFVKPTFMVSTLSALAEIANSGLDGFTKEDVALHVMDTLNVQLVSVKADEFGCRHIFAHALHKPDTPFKFDHFYPCPEEFLIPFRASFLFNDNAVQIQQLCSAVGAGDAVMVADDGISQEVTVKSGTVTKTTAQLPPDGVSLIPWRTFRDASPVESRFLLRMKGVKDGLPNIALFEIDAKWKLDTVNSVAAWLKDNVKDVNVIA